MNTVDALVIGGGPAGLMAAERLSAAGRRVLVVEAKPSVGRKLLMAGKSGLNLTHAGPQDRLTSAYDRAELAPMLGAFGPAEIQSWAEGLGQPLFTGSTGRVFPKAMKASPLLRALLARLGAQGVAFRTRHRWTGGTPDAWQFDTPDGPQSLAPATTVLAVGGASWARLGSDGLWAQWAAERALPFTAFQPSNVGLSVAWSPPMARHFGAPLKPIRLTAGASSSRGECVISAKGLEGGGVYALSPALRNGAALSLDLLPNLTAEAAASRLARRGKGQSTSTALKKHLRLSPAAIALAQEFARPLPSAPDALAQALKAIPIAHDGLRPLDEAISTAGGLSFDALDDGLMIRALPGVFAAGEMLDWDAPTGGYLLTACLATGAWAGDHAARYGG